MIQRIIVCDDDAHISLAVTMKLQRAGFDVEACANGLEALAAIERQAPDLLITDWQMPGMGGQELCRRIAADVSMKGMPIIALTGKALELGDADLDGIKVHQIVNKPFSPRHLLECVQEVLGVAVPGESR